MREINVNLITQTIASLCRSTCTDLPQDVYDRLKEARAAEKGGMAQKTLDIPTLPLHMRKESSILLIN